MTTDFYQQYNYKIKDLSQIKESVGSFPRKRRLVMCHGCFDVVHPGHVHHLAYAKNKGDLLLVSVTSDRHIQKGKDRPHVPEHLRALNLAALEMVDLVIIDDHQTPLSHLQDIQPDFFAKGFEYVKGSIPVKTEEEMEVLQSYGGEMLFTPGDVVYSSTHLIETAKPEIKIERFLSLMSSCGITFEDLKNEVSKFSGLRVHVIGDTIVDTYTYSTVIGSKGKTPTLSVKYLDEEDYLGGAGIVSKHLKSAGAEIEFTTLLGNDSLKDWVLEELKSFGIKTNPIIDSSRPTIRKNVVIADNYRLLKIDKLDNRVISAEVLDKFCSFIKKSKTDGVIFSDFRHGIFNRDTVPILSSAIPACVYRVADSQVASRWGDITEFKEFDLITPNENEGRFAVGDQDSVIGALCSKLVEEAKCNMIILKLGKEGVLTSRPQGGIKPNHYFSVGSFTNSPVDPVGAGDAMLSYATLAMLSSKNEVIATILGSLAAGCECELEGNIPITPEMIISKIDSICKVSGI
jgi:rfaE bifunctional protein kinase chain/domain/rfaE bifunctional protein nucleotidyltransferase chain/domain